MSYTETELIKILLEEFPTARIITATQLQKAHNYNSTIKHALKAVENDGITAVAYYLPPGTYGATEKLCCNGLRYGRDSSYISLPLQPIKNLKPVFCREKIT